MKIREMATSACHELMRSERMGHLGCCLDNQPYVVPVYFGYADQRIFGFSMLGQKIAYMRSNPNVCLQIEQHEKNRQWRSVIVYGEFQEVLGKRGKDHAWDILKVHNDWWEPGALSTTPRDTDTPHLPIFFTIMINAITGREATSL